MSVPKADSQSPILIQTKLRRPRLRTDLVERPRLLTRLECGVEHRLTPIHAPAGYGKTTLLCQWLEHCPHPFAWLSLDENDSELAVFYCCFVAAVQTAYPDACAGLRDLLRAPASPLLEHLAAVLVNELAELPNPLTLALDDYHFIHEPQIHQFLAQIIRMVETGTVMTKLETSGDPAHAPARRSYGKAGDRALPLVGGFLDL